LVGLVRWVGKLVGGWGRGWGCQHVNVVQCLPLLHTTGLLPHSEDTITCVIAGVGHRGTCFTAVHGCCHVCACMSECQDLSARSLVQPCEGSHPAQRLVSCCCCCCYVTDDKDTTIQARPQAHLQKCGPIGACIYFLQVYRGPTYMFNTQSTKPSPGCQKARISVPDGSSLHMKGVYQGTPGGALPAFTPTLMALMPWDTNTGMDALLRPGTSRCTAQHSMTQHGMTQHSTAA
jgi:hypothetical protein